MDCPVFFSRSPAYIGRFRSTVEHGLYITPVKNCNESKIPSQLQPSKVAYYSFICAGGLHETLEENKGKPVMFQCRKIAECQHVGANSSSPTSYSAENCGVSSIWGLTSSPTLYRSAQRGTVKIGCVTGEAPTPSLGSFYSFH